jgi:4-carboxymuconolactone decarboxylase
MSRYPPTHSSELPEEYKPYAERLEKRICTKFGPNGELMTYQDSKGALLGPFPALIASKEVGETFLSIVQKLTTLQSIPADAKEIAILVAGARFQAQFELYAHRNIATKRAGLTREQVDSIVAGRKPEGLDDACGIVYDVSYHLANDPGPLPQELYDACVQVLGKEGTLVVIHNTAFYCYVSVVLNAVDAPMPAQFREQ